MVEVEEIILRDEGICHEPVGRFVLEDEQVAVYRGKTERLQILQQLRLEVIEVSE